MGAGTERGGEVGAAINRGWDVGAGTAFCEARTGTAHCEVEGGKLGCCEGAARAAGGEEEGSTLGLTGWCFGVDDPEATLVVMAGAGVCNVAAGSVFAPGGHVGGIGTSAVTCVVRAAVPLSVESGRGGGNGADTG